MKGNLVRYKFWLTSLLPRFLNVHLYNKPTSKIFKCSSMYQTHVFYDSGFTKYLKSGEDISKFGGNFLYYYGYGMSADLVGGYLGIF